MKSPQIWLTHLSWLCLTAALLFVWPSVSGSQNEGIYSGVDVLTQHQNNARTGLNDRETVLTPDTVSATTFGKLFDKEVDGLIYAQPLIVSAQQVAGKVRNLAYVVTQHNSLYCFDADTGEQLWMRNFGPTVPIPLPYLSAARLPMHQHYWNTQGGFYRDLTPECGIISTPVIDKASQTIYLTHVVWDERRLQATQWLRAIDLLTHQDKFGSPVQVRGEVTLRNQHRIAVMPRHDLPNTLTFDPNQHVQRAALLLNQGRVVLAYAGHFDQMPFQGWVFSYNATRLQGEAPMVWGSTAGGPATTAANALGGVWQGGMGLTADAQGNIYFQTGNGTFSETLAQYGDSVVKLAAVNGQLEAVSSFTPCNQQCLANLDADLASSGILHIPGTQWIVGGGKQARIYLMDANKLGGFTGPGSHFDCPNPNIRQEFNIGCDVPPLATPSLDTPCSAPSVHHATSPAATNDPCTRTVQESDETHHIHGSPVFWRSAQHGPVIYVWAENNILRAYPFDERQGKFVNANQTPLTVQGCFDQQANPMPPWTLGQAKSPGWFAADQNNQFAQLHQGMTGGMLTISANGGKGGIVWAVTPTNNDANQRIVPGILRAYDADNLQRELWNSYQVRARDDFGNFSKNAPPTVANGKVYVATFSKRFSVYGLRQTLRTLAAPNLAKDGNFEAATLTQTSQPAQPAWTGNFKVNNAYPFYENSQGTLCPTAQKDAMLSQTLIAPATGTYELTAQCATNIQVANVMPSRYPNVTLGVNVGAQRAALTRAVTAYNGYQQYRIVFNATKQSRIRFWFYAPKVQPVPEEKCGVLEARQPANYAIIDAVTLTQMTLASNKKR